MPRRKPRFVGAGGSAEREFARQRKENIRATWLLWAATALVAVGLLTASFYAGYFGSRVIAASAGLLIGVLLVGWSLGGHISAFSWWIGAAGERQTAREIEKLGPDWHCEHDLEHDYGNWDHVVVGPPGVFLLDSKLLHGTVAAGSDCLRSGRLMYPGKRFRSGAVRVKEAIEKELGSRAPWVQAVAVIWGDFPQGQHDEEHVVYISGGKLRDWLEEQCEAQPSKLNAPRRAAVVEALRLLRAHRSHALFRRESGSVRGMGVQDV